MKLFAGFITFFWLHVSKISCEECTCTLTRGVLTCNGGSITNFPVDIIGPCPEIANQLEDVIAIALQDQPLDTLPTNGLMDFPNLDQLAMSFTNLKNIEEGAFNGLDNLTSILLQRNEIEKVPAGVFDNVVTLQVLDLTSNPIQNYTTKSWTMCHEANHGYGSFNGFDIFQDFAKEDPYGDKYCANWVQHHTNDSPINKCQETKEGTLDCTNAGEDMDLQGLGCYLANDNRFDKVLLNFPKDPVQVPVPQFGKGESAKFFRDFNRNTNMDRNREYQTIFGTKFDLATLKDRTNASVTKEVTVKADTVFLSQPMTINYRLKIRARVVSIDEKLTMQLPLKDFNRGEIRITYDSRAIFSAKTKLRHRKFGLLDIVDQEPIGPAGQSTDMCKPVEKSAKESDTSDEWFDPTLINLIYVCAATVQDESNGLRDEESKLALDIANFNLDFYSDKEVIGDSRMFVSAQKFKRVQQAAVSAKAHNVPSYTIDTIEKLAKVMHDQVKLYYDKEVRQDAKLTDIKDRIEEMQVNFMTVEMQQEQYFQMEQSILNEIFAASDNNWHWSFEHRNISDVNINNAISNTGDLISGIQETQLKEVLQEAESSVEHYKDAVNQYKTQIDRHRQKMDGQLKVLKQRNKELEDATDELDKQNSAFETNVNAYIEYQEAKLALSLVKCFFSFFTLGLAGGEVDPGAIFDTIFDAMDLLIRIDEFIKKVSYMMKIVGELNFDDFDDLTTTPTNDFSEALQQAIELKLKESDFLELNNVADVTLARVDAISDNKIKDMDKLISAVKTVGGLGQLLVSEAAEFSDILLNLLERKDDLTVAEHDLESAIIQVDNIKAALDQIEQSRNDYANDMNQSQQDYQDALKRMEEEYDEMSEETRQKFIQEITEKFEALKQVYADMRTKYMNSQEAMIDSVQDKIYGLRIASMTQRSMISVLYRDYCDALFYHHFESCDESNIPLLSDEMDTLLEKLGGLEWNSVINSQDFPEGSKPTPFHVDIYIEDNGIFDAPITQLKNHTTLRINLKDYISDNEFFKQWRWRIKGMRVYPVDEYYQVIPAPGFGIGNSLTFGINFPQTFNDTDINKDVHTFLAQKFYCRYSYQTSLEGVNEDTETCEADAEFDGGNYEPAPDGVFIMKLLTDTNRFDFDAMDKLKIHIYGNQIPFKARRKNVLV